MAAAAGSGRGRGRGGSTGDRKSAPHTPVTPPAGRRVPSRLDSSDSDDDSDDDRTPGSVLLASVERLHDDFKEARARCSRDELASLLTALKVLHADITTQHSKLVAAATKAHKPSAATKADIKADIKAIEKNVKDPWEHAVLIGLATHTARNSQYEALTNRVLDDESESAGGRIAKHAHDKSSATPSKHKAYQSGTSFCANTRSRIDKELGKTVRKRVWTKSQAAAYNPPAQRIAYSPLCCCAGAVTTPTMSCPYPDGAPQFHPNGLEGAFVWDHLLGFALIANRIEQLIAAKQWKARHLAFVRHLLFATVAVDDPDVDGVVWPANVYLRCAKCNAMGGGANSPHADLFPGLDKL